MATIKGQLAEEVAFMGEKTEDLVCFYRKHGSKTLVVCTFEDLPTREFDEGFGGVEGEPTIAFSPNYVYVRRVYDGAEDFCAVPRNPEMIKTVGNIPEVGGGSY